MSDIKVKKLSDFVWEIPKTGEMLVHGIIYADENLISHLLDDLEKKEWNALKQIYNVACLPGIQKASLAMADVHPGYGFCIGGVGAFDTETGIISVGGVGFDINCGVRTMTTPLTKDEIEVKKEKIADALFYDIPAGLGSTGDIKLSIKEIDEVLVKGARFAVSRSYGTKEDLEHIEENGCIDGAIPENVSHTAKERQFKQVGTLGSGNHYLEVQYVDEIFDANVADAFGLFKDQILISIHCGSRALGHQIGTDYLKTLDSATRKYGIPIRERELVCAPFKSPDGQQYFGAMNCGINCAFANRQVLGHLTRIALQKSVGLKEDEVKLLYDIGHNTAKLEEHGGRKLIVHRKGATRAFLNQPILVGGTMGTCSYILTGTQKGMDETFGSTIHGAGRVMSRQQAKRKWFGEKLIQDLAGKGIVIRAHSKAGAAEEAPGAYKDVNEVVDVVHNAGIAKKVAKLRPLICIKG